MPCHIRAAALAALMVFASLIEAGASSYRLLYSFKGGKDGAQPIAALVEAGGTLYGTTFSGGAASVGTVFSVNPKTGAEHVLYTFAGREDGIDPHGSLLAIGRLLYGTTTEGGGSGCGGDGCGTVFSIDIATGTHSVVHAFSYNDGDYPVAGLIEVGDYFYGTTQEGGTCHHPYGCGTVFALNRKTQAVRILHDFRYRSGGIYPDGDLIKVGSMLYGTAASGKGDEAGTIYSVNPRTGNEKAIHQFYGTAGSDDPFSGLVQAGGILYGTTVLGGGYVCENNDAGCGTIYAMDPKTGAESLVYAFQGYADGAFPYAGLAYVGGTLYGTTAWGGACKENPEDGCGTVFAFDPETGAKTIVHEFRGGRDGVRPIAGLLDVGGLLYGVTEEGGAADVGTVFAIKPRADSTSQGH